MSIRARFSALGISTYARMNMMPNPFSFTSATSTCATPCAKTSTGKCACYTSGGDVISCTCPKLAYNYDWDLNARSKKRKPKDPCADVCRVGGNDAACAACQAGGLVQQPWALYGMGVLFSPGRRY